MIPPGEGSPESAAAALRPGSKVFIADVHLRPDRADRLDAFARFLRGLRDSKPQGLFILGDLFDAWTGAASLADPRYGPVLSALKALSDAGTAVAIFKGNRDFLLDGAFARRSGARIVDEKFPVLLGERRACLCHGDHLFPEDRAHQRMRWVLRSAAIGTLSASIPPRLVVGTARWLRRRSSAAGSRRSRSGAGDEALRRIPAREAARALRGGHDILIVGHVHREGRRSVRIDGRLRDLYTLGAWAGEGSALVFDGSRLEFHRFPFIPEAEGPRAEPC